MLDAMKQLQIYIASLEHVLLYSQSVLVPTHIYELVSSPMHKSAKGNAIAAMNLLLASSNYYLETTSSRSNSSWNLRECK